MRPADVIDYVADLAAQLAEMCRAEFPDVARALDVAAQLAEQAKSTIDQSAA